MALSRRLLAIRSMQVLLGNCRIVETFPIFDACLAGCLPRRSFFLGWCTVAFSMSGGFLSGKLRLHREAERSSVRKYRGSDLSNNRISTNEISLFEVY